MDLGRRCVRFALAFLLIALGALGSDASSAAGVSPPSVAANRPLMGTVHLPVSGADQTVHAVGSFADTPTTSALARVNRWKGELRSAQSQGELLAWSHFSTRGRTQPPERQNSDRTGRESERHEYASGSARTTTHRFVATKTGAKTCLKSFGAETLVLMADGTTKPISEIVVGEVILAQDPETGEVVARPVTRLWVHEDELVRFEIDGETVRTTEDHLFWNDTDHEWQRVDQLDEGDFALTSDGRRLKIGLFAGAIGPGLAYNLSVDGIHTYHVLFGSSAVLVHNDCFPDFDTARKKAFDKAFGPGWEENPAIVATKWDPKTGTAVEFKGPGGAKVGYDGPHPETPGAYHDTQHISWQSAGKRGSGGTRGNIPYGGDHGPVRGGR
jgi:hypothetical protein